MKLSSKWQILVYLLEVLDLVGMEDIMELKGSEISLIQKVLWKNLCWSFTLIVKYIHHSLLIDKNLLRSFWNILVALKPKWLRESLVLSLLFGYLKELSLEKSIRRHLRSTRILLWWFTKWLKCPWANDSSA